MDTSGLCFSLFIFLEKVVDPETPSTNPAMQNTQRRRCLELSLFTGFLPVVGKDLNNE